MTLQNIQTLATAAKEQAIKYNNKTAFYFREQAVGYQQFDSNSNKTANGLIAENIHLNSRVAYLGKDSIYGYEILFGCAKAKTVLTPINWRLAPNELLYILNDSNTEILFVDKQFLLTIQKIRSKLLLLKKIILLDGSHSDYLDYTTWQSSQSAEALKLNYAPEDIVLQIYTSGTTGFPKGVQLANFTFFRLMEIMRSKGDFWMNLNEKDILLLALPIFHIGGIWWTIQGFLAGSTGIILDAFRASKAVKLIDKHKITKVGIVPAMMQMLLIDIKDQAIDFPSVTGVVYGGSPINTKLLTKAIETFDCDFYQVYGLTETGNMAFCLRPEDHLISSNKIIQSVGRPLPGVTVKVIDTNNNTIRTGDIGEICIKSPSNMVGYWKKDNETDLVLKNGWIHSGDAGYLDEKGYLYICDRIKDMIIYAGENIYPVEVENVINEHEAVLETAIIGIPDEKWGEVIKAFIVLRKDKTLKKIELLNYLKSRISAFKIPKSISFVEVLPRNPSGKILKTTLRAPFWKGSEKAIN